MESRVLKGLVQSAKPASAEGYYMYVDWTVELWADALTLPSSLSELGRKTWLLLALQSR